MNARTLPMVDPMFVRRIMPIDGTTNWAFFGGVLVYDEFEVEDVGLVTDRLSYDDPRVDCSRRILQITTEMMMLGDRPLAWTAFPSRRWRNYRDGEYITGHPTPSEPLLYLGNPVKLTADATGIFVERLPEFLIKTGMELGF